MGRRPAASLSSARSVRRWAVIGNRLHLVNGDVQSAGLARMHVTEVSLVQMKDVSMSPAGTGRQAP